MSVECRTVEQDLNSEIRRLRAENERLRSKNKELEDDKKSLFASLNRLELVLDSAQLGIWDWNPITNDVTFNKRWKAMLGYEVHELPDKLSSWEQAVHPDDIEHTYEVLGNHMKGNTEFYTSEHRVKTKTGDYIWILDTGRVVEHKEVDGKMVPSRVTGIHQDITHRVNLEHSLRDEREVAEKASAAKTTFLAQMSHEIRTPLNGVYGANQLLRSTPMNEEQFELCEVVHDSMEHLMQIVNDILDFSKIEMDKIELECIPFDPKTLVQRVCSMQTSVFSKKQVDLIADVDSRIPSVMGDPTRVRQIVYNLLSNAVKFTGKNGRVTVSLAHDTATQELVISVADTGIGIPESKLELVFADFVQADVSTTRQYGGTGLGLTISRRFAELMGGSLAVTSTVGEGSTFTFKFPMKAAPASTPALPSIKDIIKSRNYGKTALIAEDNPVNYKILSKLLGRVGIKTVLAQDGQQLLDMVEEGIEHDLICSDWKMPVMDGPTAVAALRANKYSKPIIMITANAFVADIEHCMRAGADRVVSKPIMLGKLVTTLDELV